MWNVYKRGYLEEEKTRQEMLIDLPKKEISFSKQEASHICTNDVPSNGLLVGFFAPHTLPCVNAIQANT